MVLVRALRALAGGTVFSSVYRISASRGLTQLRQHSSATAAEISRPFVHEQVVSRRVVKSDDIQMMGKLHGGTMLEFIEEAGDVVANEYCHIPTAPSGESTDHLSLCSITSLEKAEFFHPVALSEVVELSGQVVATSAHSLNVHIIVHSECSITGTRRLTNTASLWYTSREKSEEATPTQVPPLNKTLSPEPTPVSRINIGESYGAGLVDELHTVNQSQATSCYFFKPVHLGVTRYCRAGPVLRFMDEFGGIVGARYFRYPAVTVGVDSVNFLSNIKSLSSLKVLARPVYCSRRVLDVEVAVDMLYLDERGEVASQRAVEACFSYTGYNKTGQTVVMPNIKLKNEDEQRRFDERRLLHEKRKHLKKSADDTVL